MRKIHGCHRIILYGSQHGSACRVLATQEYQELANCIKCSILARSQEKCVVVHKDILKDIYIISLYWIIIYNYHSQSLKWWQRYNHFATTPCFVYPSQVHYKFYIENFGSSSFSTYLCHPWDRSR